MPEINKSFPEGTARINIHCGGVPEHFNHPWVLASQGNELIEKGIHLKWHPDPEGTGSLCSKLRTGKLDVAVLLTEGAVLDILSGSNFQLISSYTSNPLIWGVFASASLPEDFLENMDAPTFAISRYGSGSHLMAYMYALQRGWDLSKLEFKVVYGLEGARNMLKAGKSWLFLWEKYSTMPLVRRKEFQMLDEYPTPWSPTVIAVREEFYKRHAAEVHSLIEEVRQQCDKLKKYLGAPHLIASVYHLMISDAEEWMRNIEWTQINELDLSAFQRVVDTFKQLKLLDESLDSKYIRDRLIAGLMNHSN